MLNKDYYYQILREELIPALGCTEPIAVAYASAKAREVLGIFPDKIELNCSGNIIKNVKGVTVPCSGGLKGLDVAAILGAVGGAADRELEVLSVVNSDHIEKTKELLRKDGFFTCSLVEGVANLYINIKMQAGEHSSEITIVDRHTGIKQIKKDGKVVFSGEQTSQVATGTDRSKMNLEEIFDFAEQADPEKLYEILGRQIEMNSNISDFGLRENCGANIGSTLMASFPEDVTIRARARAAAASDARMSGCAFPVVINSGSGNQGITVSLPVIEYAKELNVSREKLLRALAISNLSSLYTKRYIGSLSAFCGAIVAASGASAAITYLHGGSHEQMARAIVNTLANVGGIVCDGAKASCAAKIASAVDAAILGYKMSVSGQNFRNGEGLVLESPEETIKAIGYIGRVGMARTDVEILNVMIDKVEL